MNGTNTPKTDSAGLTNDIEAPPAWDRHVAVQPPSTLMTWPLT